MQKTIKCSQKATFDGFVVEFSLKSMKFIKPYAFVSNFWTSFLMFQGSAGWAAIESLLVQDSPKPETQNHNQPINHQVNKL